MMEGFVMMGLCGENSNNSGSSSSNHINYNLNYSSNNNNINGVYCPMMWVTSSSAAHTANNSSNPLHQFPPTTGGDDIRRLTAARGVYYMDGDVSGAGSSESSARAKIMAHPLYPRLIAAYANCQKVGAPAEVVSKLDEACAAAASASMAGGGGGCIGEDPGLDQFMEAYCEMLTKYEQELSKPFKEAMLFLQRIESQFKTLAVASADSVYVGDGMMERSNAASSEEEVDVNNSFVDPQAEDRELKNQLLQKYSGYLGSLKQEFMKKRKKGKLPKEARQQLLDWWTRHYKWPYPSESQKLALAESTGLDQKQINNWFINQRKRHWKPSEDMQLMVLDAAHPHFYMDNLNVMPNPYPMAMDFSQTHLL